MMESIQKHRAKQILGFVNRTLKHLPNVNTKGVHEMESQLIIQAALFREQDPMIVDYCNKKFAKWYNYQGEEITPASSTS